MVDASATTTAIADGTARTKTNTILSSGHQDYILATALDAYGTRLATCSGDRTVKVWMYQAGTWTEVHSWQAHASAVTDIAWAHPEFGTLLATTGADHSWKVWQDEGRGASYTAKATLTEARRAATCVAFAPRHWGLKVATGSADGCLRLYEAVDVANLSHWPLAATLTPGGMVRGVAWCTGRFDPPTLVTASSTQGCVVYRYMEERSWQAVVTLTRVGCAHVAWAPSVGRRYHTIAWTTDAGALRVGTLERGGMGVQGTQEVEEVGVWKCEWNITGTVLAATGDAGLLQLFKKGNNGDYKMVSQVRGDMDKLVNMTQ